ncbi:zinc ribbon domain-containing protein [bacterium]|nr:zinc ribbon domain-containing protein [bacterium]
MFTCPFCGEMIEDGARACPHCGSDERTGWRHSFMPDETWDEADEADDDEYGEERISGSGGSALHPAVQWIFWIVLGLLILAFLYRTLF